MADTTDNYAQTANNAALVSLIKQYELFLFPYDTDGFTAPTGIDWKLPDGAKPLGYSSDDGAVLHPEPGDDTDITAHNGDIVYSESAPGYWTFQFPGIELNQQSVEVYFDAQTASDGSITVTKASASRKWIAVIRAIDQDGNKILIYAPYAQVSDRDDLTLIYNAQVTLNFTLKFLKDSKLNFEFQAWGLAKDFTPNTPAKTVKSIAVAVDGDGDPTVDVGSTIQLKATATYDDGTTEDVTDSAEWASDAEATATVDKGLATGKAAGDANVTAKVGDVTSAKFKLTVSAPAPTLKSIAVAPTSGTATSVAVNATLQLKATATYSDGSTKDVSSTAAWASDTTDDATVDNKGLATGKKEGSANITAKVDDVTSPNFKLTVTAAS